MQPLQLFSCAVVLCAIWSSCPVLGQVIPQNNHIVRTWDSSVPAVTSNVAALKNASMSSSTLVGAARYITDKNINSICMSTAMATDMSPWLLIDLGDFHFVYSITIIKCLVYDVFWRDFYVGVYGQKPSAPSPTFARQSQCISFTGILPASRTVDLPCLYPTAGRYVLIHKAADFGFSLQEVEVYGQRHDLYGLRNVALGKPVTVGSSRTRFPNLNSGTARPSTFKMATDGVYEDPKAPGLTCVHTTLDEFNTWLIIDLEDFYVVYALVLSTSVRAADAPVGVTVNVHIQYPIKTQGVLCYQYLGLLPAGVNETLPCFRSITGRYVHILQPRQKLAVCEIAVLATSSYFRRSRNVAIRKPAQQSSVRDNYGPKYALDGIYEQTSGLGASCILTQSADANPYIAINLETVYSIRGVRIVSGGVPDNANDRLQQFDVTTSLEDPNRIVSKSSVEDVLCVRFFGYLESGASVELPCYTIHSARYVKLAKSSPLLPVCEIEVLAAGPVLGGLRAIQVSRPPLTMGLFSDINWNSPLGPATGLWCMAITTTGIPQYFFTVDLRANYTLYGVGIGSSDFIIGDKTYFIDIFTYDNETLTGSLPVVGSVEFTFTGPATFCAQITAPKGPGYQEATCRQPILRARHVRISMQNYAAIKVCYVKYIVAPSDYGQLYNLALNMPVQQSTSHNDAMNAQKVVDGVHNVESGLEHCSKSALDDPDPWVVVDLRENYEVHSVIVRKGNATAMQDFDIHVYDKAPTVNVNGSAPAGKLCRHHEGSVLKNNMEVLHCDVPVKGRYVRLNTHDNQPIHLCEFEILGKVNVS